MGLSDVSGLGGVAVLLPGTWTGAGSVVGPADVSGVGGSASKMSSSSVGGSETGGRVTPSTVDAKEGSSG